MDKVSKEINRLVAKYPWPDSKELFKAELEYLIEISSKRPATLDPNQCYPQSIKQADLVLLDNWQKVLKDGFTGSPGWTIEDHEDLIKALLIAQKRKECQCESYPEAFLPCPHNRESWKNCPHCLGINNPQNDQQ